MSQEVVQWLNQIKALERQVADLQQALDQSQVSGDKWRQRYEIEAKQRRQEAVQQQAKVAELSAAIGELNKTVAPSEIAAERDRLAAALAAAQVSHEQTRKDLTTALSDAMELLSKGKNRLPDVVD
jgi:predicted  nucleic acid-binding Zn-ribbon protein